MITVGRRRILVTGIVQGVGFRPFVHRLAVEMGLDGTVRNGAGSVTIEVEGPEFLLRRFECRLVSEAPPLARIEALDGVDISPVLRDGFHIEPSDSRTIDLVASVPPDTAVCDACLREMRDPNDRRYRHPFVTCTDCGPRFTIITGLPYDRPKTTMNGFALCSRCATEYDDVGDRRHHAQPIGCHDCGPTIRRHDGGAPTTGTDSVLAAVQDDLARGSVVAIKGIGGYHLVVDATADTAVARLRERKHRPDKPLAIMVPDVEAALAVAELDADEIDVLTGPARPIVLARARRSSILSDLVAPANPLVGVMLPYSPLHHLLFEQVPDRDTVIPRALVVTSGNAAGESICHDDTDAAARLGALADTFLAHDRPIEVPCDDSVVRVVDHVETPIRRSRGHTPLPITLPFECPPILAVGGEIKNTFCLARGHRAWMSQHIGDIANLASLAALEGTTRLLGDLLGVEPRVIATDRHPGYRSRRWAHEVADGRPVIEVQHHHAHLAALMVEHGLDGREPVIGIVFDGTGEGDDGTLWGGEVLVGGYRDVDRRHHLSAVALPGGEAAIRNPWRVALAHLRAAGIGDISGLPPASATTEADRRVVEKQLARGLGTPMTTSMGRLFDAVASLLGVRHRISFEAQAAIELEHLATEAEPTGPDLVFGIDDEGRLDPGPVVRGLVDGLRQGVDPGALALAYHRAVAAVVVTVARHIRTTDGLLTVGLTGGVFQNSLLTSMTVSRLEQAGFEVLTHRLVPPNDGGIALGQIAVAAHRVPSTGVC